MSTITAAPIIPDFGGPAKAPAAAPASKPATMELLGARNWWIPKWLDRVLPHLNVEGAHPADAAERLLDEIAAEEPTPVG